MKATLFKLIACMVVITYSQNAHAVFNYKQGDTLYVWARSGLNMRAGASANASIIEKLPYGKRVIVADKEIGKEAFSVQMFKEYDFSIHGYWVKVTVGNKTGYVFDGFLSRLLPLKFTESNGVKHFENQLEYAQRVFKVEKMPEELPAGYNNPDDHEAVPKVYESIYGMKLETFDSGSSYKLEIDIPALSFEEGYLFANAFYDFENIKKTDVTFIDSQKIVITGNNVLYYYYTIEKTDYMLVITYLLQS